MRTDWPLMAILRQLTVTVTKAVVELPTIPFDPFLLKSI